MPDRDLPDELKARLSSELVAGVPLTAPLGSQARYATAAPAAGPLRQVRGRVLIASAALAILLAAAFAGPPQPRAWLVQTVGNIAGGIGGPASTSSPSPGNPAPAESSPKGSSGEKSPSPRATEPPDADETPGAQPSDEPRQSPEPSESPESAGSPDGGGGSGDHSSPNPSPSPDGGGSGDGN
jgi:hypothetical protein